MDIQVEGNNNRVAGRDYVELNAQLSLTQEQLQMLAIKPCPSCETRLITPQASMCNHCHQERLAADRKEAGALWFVSVVLVCTLLLKMYGPVSTPMGLFATIAGAVCIVFLGQLLLGLAQIWWNCHSEELALAIRRALVKWSDRN